MLLNTLMRRYISTQRQLVLFQHTTKTAPTSAITEPATINLSTGTESTDKRVSDGPNIPPTYPPNFKKTKTTIKTSKQSKVTLDAEEKETPLAPKSMEDLKKWASSAASRISYTPTQETMDQLKAATSETVKTGTTDLRHLSQAPSNTLILGALGTVPLVLTPLSMLSSGMFSESAAMFQIAYAAAGLGFSSGLQWTSIAATKESNWNQLGIASLPMFMAFSSLMITPVLAPPVLSAGMLMALYTDQRGELPQWFRGLRAAVTAGAVFGLMVTFLLRIILPSAV